MNKKIAKYHHLIPQTYMSAWANKSGTLSIEFLDEPGKLVERNKQNIAGKNDYHSIVAGMLCCTKADTDMIFKPLEEYIVKIDGKIVKDTLEMNRYFYNFDSWTISRKDDSLVGKKEIKSTIEKIKIKDIEILWSQKYERYWAEVVDELKTVILNSNSVCIPAIRKDFLMKFLWL